MKRLIAIAALMAFGACGWAQTYNWKTDNFSTIRLADKGGSTSTTLTKSTIDNMVSANAAETITGQWLFVENQLTSDSLGSMWYLLDSTGTYGIGIDQNSADVLIYGATLTAPDTNITTLTVTTIDGTTTIDGPTTVTSDLVIGDDLTVSGSAFLYDPVSYGPIRGIGYGEDTTSVNIQASGMKIEVNETDVVVGLTSIAVDVFSVTNTGDVAAGANDGIYGGDLLLYGDSATSGGRLRLYNSGDEDGTVEWWTHEAVGTSYNFGPDTDLDAFIFTSAGAFTATSLVTGGNVGIAADTDLIQLTGANTVVLNGSLGLGGAPSNQLHGVKADPVWYLQDSGNADSALARTMTGLQLSATTFVSPNIYTPAIKFMATDADFSTNNPRLNALIVGRATQVYNDNDDGGMAIDFGVKAVNAGASAEPTIKMTLDSTGYLGLGNTAPSYNLDVTGTARITSTAAIGGAITSTATGANTFTGPIQITSTGTAPFALTSTDASATAADVSFSKLSASPDVLDGLLNLNVYMKDSAANTQLASQVAHVISSPTDGAEEVTVSHYGTTGGASTRYFRMDARKLKVDVPLQYTPSSTQNLTSAGDAILANASRVKITCAGSINLASTPHIADGTDGQILTIENVDDTDSLTLNDESGVAGSNLELGAATRVLGPGDRIQLTFSSSLAAWGEDWTSDL